MERFYDVVQADDLGEPFDSSERCRFEVESESLPDEWGAWSCYRPVWNGHDRCIWHVEDAHKPTEDLHRAQEFEYTWPRKYTDIQLTRRLDRTNLRSYSVDPDRQESAFEQPLGFSNCTMIGSNFYHSDFSQSTFQNVHLNRSNFEDASLRYTIFQGCDLGETIFKYADLRDSRILRQDVQEANWLGVDLRESNLHDSDFTGTNLRLAKFEGTYMTQASLQDCNLEEAELEKTDLRDVDLTDAKLFEALVREARINEGTEFGRKSAYEARADSSARGSGDSLTVDWPVDILGGLKRGINRLCKRSEDVDYLEKSTRVYRLYQRLLRQASLPEEVRQYRIRERHSRRKSALRNGEYLRWLKLAFDRWVMLYGESPVRVIGISILTVLGFALLYLQAAGTALSLNSFSRALYLSSISFISSAGGDLRSTTGSIRLLSSIESLSGAFLTALFVFVLGRRATW